MPTFGDILRNLRKGEKLTQLQLANALGVAFSTISMYERGEREPDFETLEAIADFFNVSMDYLYGKTDLAKSVAEQDEEYIKLKSMLADLKSGNSRTGGAVIGFGGHGQELLNITDEEFEMVKAMLAAKHKARENNNKN